MRLVRAIFVASLLLAVAASAQNNRSFVSTAGSDGNDCTAGHECRSFTKALSVTNYGGEVVALTSGGYGPFTVTQAVSVIAATGAASITATSVDGVDISGFSGDRVVLRGLNITITGGVGVGINAGDFGSLAIENCTVNGGAVGVLITGDTLSRTAIADTAVRGAAGAGFVVNGRAILVRCRAEKNGASGLLAAESSNDGRVTATDFVGIGNQNGAMVLVTTTGHSVYLSLDRAVLSDNTIDGVFCNAVGGSVAQITIGYSTVTDNFRYGLNASTGGTLNSMKNNLVAGNTTSDTNGAIVLWAGQ